MNPFRAKTQCAPSLYAAGMQRLFSMFAGGAAGVALVILRVCAIRRHSSVSGRRLESGGHGPSRPFISPFDESE
jgi:hypothetical protein